MSDGWSLGDVNASFHLAGLGRVGDEAQPGVGREVWWTEIDELLPGDAGMNDPIRCGHVVAVLKPHLQQVTQPVSRARAHRSGRVEVLVIGLVPDTAPLPADPREGAYRHVVRDDDPASCF